MMDIRINTIPHSMQRYPTVGDWKFWDFDNTVLQVLVSNMQNEDYELLVGIHELVEAYLCKKRGIPEELVTAFDTEFENRRELGSVDEPGNDPSAPYYKEHVFATKIEKLIADELNINWEQYDEIVNAL